MERPEPSAMPPRKTLTVSLTPEQSSRNKTIGYRVAALKAAIEFYGAAGAVAELMAPEVLKTAEIFEQWIGRE